MSKPLPKYDYEHKLEPDLIRFLSRIEDVEDSGKKTSRFMQMKTLEWDSSMSEFRRNVNMAKNQLEEIRRKKSILKQNFINIVNEFRTKGGDDDFNKLQRKVDDWKLEEFITKKEFIQLLSEI